MTRPLDDWLEQIQQRHSGSIELGLERCRKVWRRMGCPAPARRVITVAGTNGKGSTVAGIESGLTSVGRIVGAYTSPHLLRYNERIRIAGSEADDKEIIAGFEVVEQALGSTRLTYFEFVTLAALATMSQANLDDAVLEIGLGGRLDAVNLIDADLSVITAIGLDHQEYLGHDRESIGREKAGVMRAGQTVICSDRDPPSTVFERAQVLGARLIRIGADFDVSRDIGATGRDAWAYFFADLSCRLPVSMSGGHQADNLAAALTAVVLLEPDARSELGRTAAAVAGCRVRGRLERIRGTPEVVVDVGHNPLAAGVIRDYLDSAGHDRCLAVVGMLRDKNVESVAAVLDTHVSRWYCAGLGGERGQTAEAVAARIMSATQTKATRTFETVSLAIDAAIDDAGSDGLVLVFGSFLTAAQAIMHIEGLDQPLASGRALV